MKTKHFLFAFGVLLITACTQQQEPQQQTYPTSEELQRYRDSLLLYFPYSADEEFVFVNDESGQTWQTKANDLGRGEYPIVDVYPPKISGSENDGFWFINVTASMLEQGMPSYTAEANYTSVSLHGAWMGFGPYSWNFQIYNSEEKKEYPGTWGTNSLSEDDFLHTADTIIIPISPSANGSVAKQSDGAYARLVKNQGLTDFSIDGKTVWRRVKE